MANTPSPDLQFVAINGWMPEEYRATVVNHVLASLSQASGDARQLFKSIVGSYKLRLNGFRDPFRAPPALLHEPISQLMYHSDELVGAVLRIWMESHTELYEVVSQHLSAMNMSTQGPDFSENRFTGTWNTAIWLREKEKLVASHSEFCEDDIALMLCSVSGKMWPLARKEEEPRNAINEAFFSHWLEELRALPAAAPQWEQAVDFITAATEIIEAKEEERHQITALQASIAEIRDEFPQELTFFQWDINCLSVLPAFLSEVLDLLTDVKSLLTEYQPVHEIAPVISQELARRQKRSELQQRILDTIEHIDQRLGDGPAAAGFLEESAHRTETDALVPPQVTDAPDLSTNEGRPVEGDGELRTAAAEIVDSRDEDTALAEEKYRELKFENQTLKKEIKSLRSTLHTSQSKEKTWRLAYEEERKGPDTDEDKFVQIEDVRTAVGLAREKFTDKLLFHPNSKSDIDANPFEKPKEVWSALEWLANIYYPSRIGKSRVPDFDLSIREDCGWWYKSHQCNMTMNKYKSWYTIIVDSKIYWLHEHIGTGSSKDARHTIRIGFDWDKERKKVIIGYIGRHQRTDAT